MLHNRKCVIRGELWHSSMVRRGKIFSINIEPFANLGLGLRLQVFLLQKMVWKSRKPKRNPKP